MEACFYILAGTVAAHFNRSSQEAVNTLVSCSFAPTRPLTAKNSVPFRFLCLLLLVFLCLHRDVWGSMDYVRPFFFCFGVHIVL